jgi:N-dimethylarginine dimethylaminohydrolase
MSLSPTASTRRNGDDPIDAPGRTPSSPHRERTATKRHYLMCRPAHFTVSYAINPWMNPDKPVDPELALKQWTRLKDTYEQLGHTVDVIEDQPGLPDMVFAANGATVIDGRVLGARFRNAERVPEGPAYQRWFREHGYTEVHDPAYINEGEGDFLTTEDALLAGFGFRSDPPSHAEAQEFFGRPVVSLRLVDPRFYHLDTAFAVLDADTVMYLPEAFSSGSRRVLERMFPNAIHVGIEDAEVLGLNAVSDGRHVVLPAQATGVIETLRAYGFEPIGVDMSELLKAGGSCKCCTLELRPARSR